MNLALKTMDFAFKMIDFALKMMDVALKMVKSVGFTEEYVANRHDIVLHLATTICP